MMKTARLHVFELLQKIQDFPYDQTLLPELDKHLVECAECHENVRLYHDLQNTARVRFPITSGDLLADAQMITAVKKRVQRKQLLIRLFRPFPGLAWITIAIIMVVLLNWVIASLRTEQNITPASSAKPFTPTPTATEIYQVLEDCRTIVYMVEEKNTLLAISAYFNVAVYDIWKENKLGYDSVLKPGMSLIIPFCGWTPVLYTYDFNGVTPINNCPPVRYTVQQGETLEIISTAFNVPVSTIVADNQLDNRLVLSPGESLVITLCKSP